MTLVAGSPCEWILWNFRYSTIFLATPAEPRKPWVSKPRFLSDLVLDLMLPELATAFIKLPLDENASRIIGLNASSAEGSPGRSLNRLLRGKIANSGSLPVRKL